MKMELMDEVQSDVQCLICNEVITDEHYISLSDENVKTSEKGLIDSIISQILEQHSNGTVLHCDTLCQICYNSFKQVHEMENKLNAQRLQLMNRFKPMNTTITLCEEDVNSVNITSDGYIGPKKILDIPSSDEEEEEIQMIAQGMPINEEKKLKTIEEIEEELVKIHGPADDITLEDIQKSNEDSDNKLDETLIDDSEQLQESQFIKIEALEDDKTKVLRRTINYIKSGQEKEDKFKLQRELKDELSADNVSL